MSRATVPGIKQGAGLATLPCLNPECRRPMIGKLLWRAHPELHGRYAALGARQLCRPCYGKLRQGTLQLDTQIPALVLPCGTPAAYRRHRKAEEAPCSPCAAAYRKDQAQRSARRRAANGRGPSRRGGLARCEILPALKAGSTPEQVADATRCVERYVADLGDRAMVYAALGLA